jgi:hypothetical protein
LRRARRRPTATSPISSSAPAGPSFGLPIALRLRGR